MTTPRYCFRCGTALFAEATYCQNCGTRAVQTAPSQEMPSTGQHSGSAMAVPAGPIAPPESRPPPLRAEQDASEAQRVAASMKSYTGAAVLVFFLYWLFWLPGLIVNYMYYREARRMEQIASHGLPGVGCLVIMLWVNAAVFVGILAFALLLGVGVVLLGAATNLTALLTLIAVALVGVVVLTIWLLGRVTA